MYNEFDEYLEAGEPSRRERAYGWATAIGLQDVDGLKVSDFLINTARRNIEGEITQAEAGRMIDEYYETKEGHDQPEDKKEADTMTKFINNVNSMYENKLALYSSIINDELNIIAKYIDTYMNLNIIDNIKINIPLLQNITNFPNDNKLSSFSNMINSVENALKRIINQNKIIKNTEMNLKQEINKLNNILEKKNKEN